MGALVSLSSLNTGSIAFSPLTSTAAKVAQ